MSLKLPPFFVVETWKIDYEGKGHRTNGVVKLYLEGKRS